MGDSPLHGAAAKGHLRCVQALVEAGADLYGRNRDAKRPADLAKTVEVAAFLQVAMQRTPPADAELYDSSGDEGTE